MLLKPFLQEENNKQNVTTETPLLDIDSTPMPFSNSTEKSQLYIPLSIGGSIIVLGGSIILFLFFFDKYVPPPQDPSEENQVNEDYYTSPEGFYQGMELCTFQFLPTFTH
ncbi:unnamed protein product, partial [Allacma fusca]